MVTGPNGAGKSSLLRLIAGLVRPAGGQLALEGGDPELTIGEQAHYLGHQDALKPSLTVAENLDFWAQVFWAARPQAPEPALGDAASGLDAHRGPAGRLSLGRPAAAPVDRAPARGASGRSGCSTSRPPRSTPPPRRRLPA